jgi:mannose/fructose/N-acetylgalactosamine-specific phosphotransferase system component IIC
LELWLETGWIGAAIVLVFLAWFASAALRAWRTGSDVARAASVAILLLMAESAVDYPLRTETLAVLFAFCCGTLAQRDEARP